MILCFIEVDPEDTQAIRKKYPDALTLPGTLQDGDTFARCSDAEVLSCFIYSHIGEQELAALPRLKLLCTRSVGYDHIDLEACREHDVTVCNVPDYGSHVIAEHVFALLLATLRHIHEADERVEKGAFDYHGLRGMSLRGKTLGIVGTGKIGRITAQIAHGFGMRILAVDICKTLELETRYGVQYVECDTLLRMSDIITLHVNLTTETRHMINAPAIAKMRDGAIIVNTARGALIDQNALLAALKSGKIRLALLDVLEGERDFAGNRELIEHPNVVTTPHIAFYADDSMRSMYLDCFDSIDTWIDGREPGHNVHPLQVICDLPGIRPT